MGEIQRILESSRVIAVVGLSRSPAKAAHTVPARMQAAGFRIIPVNPNAEEILGERAYATLGEVPDRVDMVDVFRPSAEAPAIAGQAAAMGAKALWLQLGISSPEARRIARDAGMDYVEDRCMAVERARYAVTKSSGRTEG